MKLFRKHVSFLLALLLTLGVVTSRADSKSPQDGAQGESPCRYQYYAGQYTWQEAQDLAAAMGGHLINIESAAEYSEILSDILEIGCTDLAFWTGARRDVARGKTAGAFFWSNTEAQPVGEEIEFTALLDGRSPWALGEPSYRSEQDERENFVLLRYSEGEARWVLDNVDGSVPDGLRLGCIVEFDDRPSRARLTAKQVELLTQLTLEEPPYNALGNRPLPNEENSTGLEPEWELCRVTSVLSSSPVKREEGSSVSILDAWSGEQVTSTGLGQAVYLKPGSYRARLKDGGADDAVFTVEDVPVTVVLRDQPTGFLEGRVLDSESENPVAGAKASLEIQGETISTTTDDDGTYRFDGLPPVDAQLSLKGADIETSSGPRPVTITLGSTAQTTQLVKTRKSIAFIGFIRDGEEDFHAKYKAWWASIQNKFVNQDIYRYIGFSYYAEVQKDIFGSGPQGTKYNMRITMLKNIEAMDLTDQYVISGTIEKERIKEEHPECDGWFEGWSDQRFNTVMVESMQEGYYRRLLESIKAGENPLNDEVFKAVLEKHLLDGAISSAHAQKILNTLNAAPDTYRDLYLLSLFNYQLGITTGSESQYDSTVNELQMKVKIPEKTYEIEFFHESGHALLMSPLLHFINENENLARGHNVYPKEGEYHENDERIGAVYDHITGDLFEALKADTEKLIRKELRTQYSDYLTEEEVQRIIDAFISPEQQEYDLLEFRLVPADLRTSYTLPAVYEWVRSEIEKKVRTLPTTAASIVSDILGGITNNKLAGGSSKYLTAYGHPSIETDENGKESGYWYDLETGEPTFRQSKEAWAEYFSAMINNDAENIENNRNYFSEAVELMDSMTKDLYDYYVWYWTRLYS